MVRVNSSDRAHTAETARTVRWLGATLACASLAAAGPRPALPATTVLIVSVGDAANGAFVADAQVRLPSVGRVARTAWDGEARFPGLQSGRFHIQVRAIGYAPGDIDMPVSGDSASVLFNLERITTALDTVRVVAPQATRAARGLKEFEERRQAGIGRFITDSALIEHRAQGLQLFLATGVPGLMVFGHGVVAGGATDGGRCPVLFYLDGFKLTEMPSGPSDLRAAQKQVLDLDALRLEHLAGIEVYSRTSAPAQYKPSGDYCKVILLWTKW